MKTFGIIFKKTSTAFATKNLSVDYLDETSNIKNKNLSEKKSIHYMAKEELGQVHAAGFLHKLLVLKRNHGDPSPSLQDNETRKNRILTCWHEHFERYGRPKARQMKYGKGKSKEILGHKAVISFSEAFYKKLIKKGVNPDQVLHQTVKIGMRKFQEKFVERGDSIGYAYGFHHDTDNLHAHIFLMPTTERGRRVGLSGSLETKKHLKSRHLNQIGYIREQMELQEARWLKILDDPKKLAEFKTRYNSEKLLIEHGIDLKIPKDYPIQAGPVFERDPRFYADLSRMKQLQDSMKKIRETLKTRRNSINNQTIESYGFRLSGIFTPPKDRLGLSKMAQDIDLISHAISRQKLQKQYHQLRSLYAQELQKLKNQDVNDYGQLHPARIHRKWEVYHAQKRAASQKRQSINPATRIRHH